MRAAQAGLLSPAQLKRGMVVSFGLATLANFSIPGDSTSASRYFKRDTVNEPLEAADGGMPVPSNGAGIGVTLNRDYMKTVTSHYEMIRP